MRMKRLICFYINNKMNSLPLDGVISIDKSSLKGVLVLGGLSWGSGFLYQRSEFHIFKEVVWSNSKLREFESRVVISSELPGLEAVW